jgi:UDP-N-acetylmuramate dehydrogenase
MDLYQTLHSMLPDVDIYQNHPLAPYTTLKIGGPAQVFVQAKTYDQFISILKLVRQLINQNLLSLDQVFILGAGSNLLVSDQGFPGLVIKNSASGLNFTSGQVTADSGTPLPFLITQTLSQSLTGLEYFAYIPANLGGAIYSNIHGVNQAQFSDYLDSIQVFDLKTGQTSTLTANSLSWDYDTSHFQSNPNLIILSAALRLYPQDPSPAQHLYQQTLSQKSQNQPMNSAGCVFKNPPGFFAGQIIDELGWKGKTIGDAQICPTHANFIVNNGQATAQNYLDLAKAVQADVFQKKGIKLDFEIKLVGDFSL